MLLTSIHPLITSPTLYGFHSSFFHLLANFISFLVIIRAFPVDFSFGSNLLLKLQWSGLGFLVMLLWFWPFFGECFQSNSIFLISYDTSLMKEPIGSRIIQIR